MRRALERTDVRLLIAAAVLGFALRLTYVLVTGDHALRGDEIEYDIQGRFILDGKWFWSTTPYGVAHESLWKTPGYVTWVGLWYWVFGPDPDHVLIVQTLIGPVTIVLAWALARRLFGERVAIAAAFLVAVYPLAWQFEARLYSESLATPIVLAVLLLVLDREPTMRRALGAGALLGLGLLVRPGLMWLVVGTVVALLVAAPGFRRGAALASAAVAVAVLCVAPWTVRNYVVFDSFVPFSFQDGSVLFGTFNDDAANDPVYRYAWRANTQRDRELFDGSRRLPDDELRSELASRAFDYIRDHPDSVPKAFFWNGLSRLWDIRRPARATIEVPFEGRSYSLTRVGLVMYWILLPMALIALWRHRRRRALVLPLLAIAVFASIQHTPEGRTRYRAPLEPVIAILACAAPRRMTPS